ncbi:hypothetical protein ACI65C_006721 [Semiaphis heraclei]
MFRLNTANFNVHQEDNFNLVPNDTSTEENSGAPSLLEDDISMPGPSRNIFSNANEFTPRKLGKVDRVHIEKETRDQASSELWRRERLSRLTDGVIDNDRLIEVKAPYVARNTINYIQAVETGKLRFENLKQGPTYGITKAIDHWKNNGNLTHNQKVTFLKKDIDNGPYHVFGSHYNCNRYLCKPKPDNINYVPEMENCGLWQDISAAKNLVSFNSDSLIYDLTNNYVESYNSIVAKFVGGKRINYSLRGSYNTRCMTAVSAFNFGPEYIRRLHKTPTKQRPGKFTKRFISKLQRAKAVRSKTKKKLNFKTSIKFGADKDYGDLDELGCAELEISSEELEAKRSSVINSLKLNSQEIFCQCYSQGKCDTWHTERKHRLTASTFGRVCKLRKSTPRTNTVKYGIQYEPVAREAFESLFNVKVLPAGLFVDEQFNFLAGSPDGLVGEN